MIVLSSAASPLPDVTPPASPQRRAELANAPTVPGQYWTWRGQAIYYVAAGQPTGDRPPLLLVHGFGASTDHWRKNIAELQDSTAVYAIDLLGFGRSAKPAWDYSGDLWRDQLTDFIQQVIGQPAVLVGNSLGGYASLCVAAQRPEAARGVALLNSAGPFRAPEETGDGPTTPTWKTTWGKVVRSLLLQPWVSYFIFQRARQKSTIRKTLQKVYVDQSAVTDRLVDEIYSPSCDPGAAGVFASVFKARQGESLDRLLAGLSCPLLLIWGEGDPWMRVSERSRQFEQYAPAQTLSHRLAAGHCPHDEAPEQVNALLLDWLATL